MSKEEFGISLLENSVLHMLTMLSQYGIWCHKRTMVSHYCRIEGPNRTMTTMSHLWRKECPKRVMVSH